MTHKGYEYQENLDESIEYDVIYQKLRQSGGWPVWVEWEDIEDHKHRVELHKPSDKITVLFPVMKNYHRLPGLRMHWIHKGGETCTRWADPEPNWVEAQFSYENKNKYPDYVSHGFNIVVRMLYISELEWQARYFDDSD